MNRNPNSFILLFCLAITVGLSLCIVGVSVDQDGLTDFGAALLTLAAIFAALAQFTIQSVDTDSKFYLDEAVKGIEAAFALLRDGNNNRVTWVLAARILSRVQVLAGNLTSEAHKSVYAIHKDIYRVRFGDILLIGVHDRGAFFYGVEEHIKDLDDARAKHEEVHDVLPIPESAIREVFEFAKFPRDYDNTLKADLDKAQRQQIDFFTHHYTTMSNIVVELAKLFQKYVCIAARHKAN
jgi:hypothetical protein